MIAKLAKTVRPEPYIKELSEDSALICWTFPRGTKDRAVRAEVERQGYDENKPCRCTDGDCCGATFTRSLLIYQAKHSKRAELFTGTCL